jgi:hypothetical protein
MLRSYSDAMVIDIMAAAVYQECGLQALRAVLLQHMSINLAVFSDVSAIGRWMRLCRKSRSPKP